MATGRPPALARPTAKKAQLRSSTWTRTVSAGWRAKAIASGAEREPGARQMSVTPDAASWSAKVAANRSLTSGSSMFVQVSGTGPPVTLLHGFMQDGSSWAELLRLMPAQWRWLRPDLPGHGQSPARAAPSVRDAAAELIAEWDRLGVERSHLAGYSLGGRLALYLAVEHPDRLLSPASNRAPAPPAPPRTPRSPTVSRPRAWTGSPSTGPLSPCLRRWRAARTW